VEKIKAKERKELTQFGNTDTQNSSEPVKGETRKIVADKSGFGSHDTYNKAKYISENADEEMIKALDEGKLSINKAYITLKQEKESLSKINQELQNKNNELITKLQQQEQLQQKINEMEVELSQRPEVEIEVIPEDYEEVKKKLEDNNKYYDNLKKDYDKKIEQLKNLEQEIKSLKTITEEEKYAKKLKDSAIFFCARVNDFIEKTGGFVWLSENINELPEFERKSYIKAIEMVENWATAMKMNMKNYLG
jgi:ParB family chromosome partitioning protein